MNPDMLDKLQKFDQVTRAIEIFDGGGHIVSMQVASRAPLPVSAGGTGPVSPSPMPIPMFATVDTSDMAFPQMIETIKAALADKRKALASDLAKLGVTGFDK